jgi:hypothetical protein
MKFLLHQLLLLKVEKKIQKIIQEKKYKHLYTQSNLSQSYTHWAFSDYQQLAEIINSNTIIGGVKLVPLLCKGFLVRKINIKNIF